MKKIFSLYYIFILFILCVHSIIFATNITNHEPSPLETKLLLYLQIPDYTLSTLSNQNTVNIDFCDTRIKTYCARPNRNLQLQGQKITEGISIEPYIEGEWRFKDNSGIIFTPKNYFLTNQTYKVTIDKTILPYFIDLTSNVISFQTIPLLPIIREMSYLSDGNNIAKKYVQTKLEFNYPIDPKSLEEKLTFTISKTNKILPFSTKFNHNNTEIIIINNIQALEQDEQIVSLTIGEGVKPLYGGENFYYKNINNKEFLIKQQYITSPPSYKEQVLIPSIYTYFKITNASVNIVKNNKFIPQQVVIINTNVPVATKELQNHMELLLLPQDKLSSFYDGIDKKQYRWKSVAEINSTIINQSEKLVFENIPSPLEYSTLHSFKINSLPSRSLLLTIKQGLKSYGDFILGHDYKEILNTNPFPQEIKLISDGSILPLSGDKKLSVYSLGIDKIHVEIDKININNINHLISQTSKYSSFQNPVFINNATFNEYNISQIFEEDINLNPQDNKIPQYSTLDFTKYLKSNSSSHDYSKGLFLTKVSYKNTENNHIIEDKRLILVTDLGFIVKVNQDGSHDIFVSSITKSTPLKEAKIDIIGLNGQILGSVMTDNNGHATFPNIKNFTKDKIPTAYIITYKDDLSFMPYNRVDRQVNYSRFDVSGIKTSKEGLKAYLFSDRGIYRPGEKGHIGIMVKQPDWQGQLTGLPLELCITNPHGQIIDKKKILLNSEGFVEYLFQTNETSITGTYNISLHIVKDGLQNSQLGKVSVRIEDFLPDKMKITSSFGDIENKLWVKDEKLKSTVTLTNLYGTPASNRKVAAHINISPAKFVIPNFKDYIFYSGKENSTSFNTILNDIITNEQGQGEFDLNLEKYNDATYLTTFFAEGFEADSGRSVNTKKSILISPLPYIVGFKSDTNLKYIKHNHPNKIEFIAIDNIGNKVTTTQLQLELKKINYINSLMVQPDGSYAYQTVPMETSISKTPINIPKTSSIYNLPTHEVGDYAIYLIDNNNTIFAHTEFSVIGEGNVTTNLTKTTNLTIKTNKNSYKAGEEIEVSIISPYAGYGLITIETNKVHSFNWFKANNTSSIQKIKIPKDFEGKGFVNVQFIRSINSQEIFIPPFSYATTSFTADVDKHNQKIYLNTVDQIKPGQELKINYSTEKSGKIVIFAVDEGILLFNHYQLPNPINYFIKERALEVTTSHIMDLILPENSVAMRAYSAIGGDNFISNSKNLNPFKRKDQPPVAFWSGIVDSTKDQKEVKFNIPDYFNGTLKVMAVSAADNSIGATDTNVIVQGDFVINPNIPLFIAPQDEFIIPITIANNINNSGIDAKIKLDVQSNDGIEIIDYPKEILISANKENVFQVKARASDKLGSETIKITASINNINSIMSTTTTIRPPLPNITTLDTGYSNNNDVTVNISRNLYKEFGTIQLSVSQLPLAIINGFREYLDNYPFGCTEQLISKNFPNVMLYDQQDLVKILNIEKEKLNKTLDQIFVLISERQNDTGGFNVWGNYGETNDFTSVYTMHFLTEAAIRYLPVPYSTFNKGIEFLKNMANRSINSLEQAREKSYAIYILSRNNEITTNYIANVLNYLETSYKDSWKDDLAAIYIAASYKMLQMTKEANDILDKFNINNPINTQTFTNYNYYDNLIKYSQYLYIISLHFPERLKLLDKKIVSAIADLTKYYYNTLTSSYAIMASLAYTNAIEDISIKLKTYDQDKQQQEINLQGNKIMVADLDATNTKSLELISTKEGFFYQISISGFDKQLGDSIISKNIELTREYLDDSGKKVSKVKLGDVITVSFTMRSGTDSILNNIAVVDLLPGGFELHTTDNNVIKIEPYNDKITEWVPIYVDKREDRIIMFGTIPNYEVIYKYKIRAINRGTFATPALYSESMYRPNIYYRGTIGSIIVE